MLTGLARPFFLWHERQTPSPGSPAGWDAERVLAFKIIGAVAGFVGALLLLQLLSFSSFLQLVIIALLTFVGFIVPDTVLNSRVEDRKKEILSALSDTLDLLTISVEAGLSLNAAIAMVVRNVPGVLSQEFGRMLQEIQLGVPRSDAFRHLAERTDVEELNAFALAMVQADVFGVSIASVLRTQAAQLRIKRRQAIEQKLHPIAQPARADGGEAQRPGPAESHVRARVEAPPDAVPTVVDYSQVFCP